MIDFNVFDIFGKKIVGVLKVSSHKTELLFDDESRLVFIAGGYGLTVDYLEKP